MLVAILTWFNRVAKHEAGFRDAISPQAVVTLMGALAFLWIKRGGHAHDSLCDRGALHAGRAMALDAGAGHAVDPVVVIALSVMAIANRRQWRIPWIVGATLLGAVVPEALLSWSSRNPARSRASCRSSASGCCCC
jgi:hypothetical protein